MHPDGEHALVAEFGGAPFPEGGSRVMSVDLRSGEQSVFADRLTQAVDIAALPDGTVAVLQHMNKSLLPPGRNSPDAGIVILSRDGDRLSEFLQIDGLKGATGIAAGADGILYVSSNGNAGENRGTLVAIDLARVQ